MTGDEIQRAYDAEMLKILKAANIELSRRIIMRTPVDTGLLRRTWTPVINGKKNINLSRTASSSLATITTKVNGMTLKDDFDLINNQPYAEAIEGGHSQQAPNGMLAISIAEWQSIVDGVS